MSEAFLLKNRVAPDERTYKSEMKFLHAIKKLKENDAALFDAVLQSLGKRTIQEVIEDVIVEHYDRVIKKVRDHVRKTSGKSIVEQTISAANALREYYHTFIFLAEPEGYGPETANFSLDFTWDDFRGLVPEYVYGVIDEPRLEERFRDTHRLRDLIRKLFREKYAFGVQVYKKSKKNVWVRLGSQCSRCHKDATLQCDVCNQFFCNKECTL